MNILLLIWQCYCLVLAVLTLQLYTRDPLLQQMRSIARQAR